MNTLVMKFLTKAGKTCTIRVPSVRENLTAQEANTVMDLFVSSNVFFTGQEELESISSVEVNSVTPLV